MINNKSFYTELPWYLKFTLIFIRGDIVILLPALILIGLLGFFSISWMIVAIGVFIAVRELGEMIYWLLQQFGDKKYRPYDFGFKKLDNNAIYILYQTASILGVVIGVLIAVIGAIKLQ